jgi:hypothetical protein
MARCWSFLELVYGNLFSTNTSNARLLRFRKRKKKALLRDRTAKASLLPQIGRTAKATLLPEIDRNGLLATGDQVCVVGAAASYAR